MIKFVQLCLKFFLFIFLGVSNVSHVYSHVYTGYSHLLRIDFPPPTPLPPPLLQLCVYGLHFLVMCMWVKCGLWLMLRILFYFICEGFLTHFWWCACAKVTRKNVLTSIVRLSGSRTKLGGLRSCFCYQDLSWHFVGTSIRTESSN